MYHQPTVDITVRESHIENSLSVQVEGGIVKEFVVDNLTIYIEVVSKNLSNNSETSSVASLCVFSVHSALDGSDWVDL